MNTKEKVFDADNQGKKDFLSAISVVTGVIEVAKKISDLNKMLKPLKEMYEKEKIIYDDFEKSYKNTPDEEKEKKEILKKMLMEKNEVLAIAYGKMLEPRKKLQECEKEFEAYSKYAERINNALENNFYGNVIIHIKSKDLTNDELIAFHFITDSIPSIIDRFTEKNIERRRIIEFCANAKRVEFENWLKSGCNEL